MNKINTCEDCLHHLVNDPVKWFTLAYSDVKILTSISKQLDRKIALTDRQYELVKSKLLSEGYYEQLHIRGVDVDECVKNLKYPLRKIDRTHELKLTTDDNGETILVMRFPFSKKIIDRIDELRRIQQLPQTKLDNKTHAFAYSTQTLFALVQIAKRFETKFIVDKEILEIYDQLVDISNNKDSYIPGIYNNKLCNLPEVAVTQLQETLGDVEENLSLYYDRRFLYGLKHFEDISKSVSKLSVLGQKIINRKDEMIIIDKGTYQLTAVIDAILELKRLPILVVCDKDDALLNLHTLHNVLKNIIPREEMSVLFRLDSPKGDEFNTYVKENNLNNMVDKHTKVVYINNIKLPKPLLRSDWKPSCVFAFRSSIGGRLQKVSMYTQTFDFQIYYEDSTFKKFFNPNTKKMSGHI